MLRELSIAQHSFPPVASFRLARGCRILQDDYPDGVNLQGGFLLPPSPAFWGGRAHLA